MKRLLIVRHAKAEVGAGNASSDFDRALNERGVSQLARLSELFPPMPTPAPRLLFSPANRARATAEAMMAAFPALKKRAIECPEMYLASHTALCLVIAGQSDDETALALVGHNPGLLELVDFLAPDAIEDFPTLAVAVIDCAVETWAALYRGCGALVSYMTPGILKRRG